MNLNFFSNLYSELKYVYALSVMGVATSVMDVEKICERYSLTFIQF
jgi:hypothetical protein